MASQPHDKSGKKCTRCPAVFTNSSLTLTLSKREGNMLVHELVCSACHHKHYEASE